MMASLTTRCSLPRPGLHRLTLAPTARRPHVVRLEPSAAMTSAALYYDLCLGEQWLQQWLHVVLRVCGILPLQTRRREQPSRYTIVAGESVPLDKHPELVQL